MKSIFVDTSALVAIGDKSDNFHEAALQIYRELFVGRINFVVTDAIIFEVANYFSKASLKSIAIKLIHLIYQTPAWQCIQIDRLLRQLSLERYEKMNDKDWSLTDCSSMVVAQSLGITQIFTNDHHFEQARFTILLK